ncbi:MAG: arsenate reductase (azurin) small subunit [Halieaceae bacterium]|jgi:arsenite oxidase small subunit|nr:arsenate reductase (azurin) small subunit [Halieaceae bacterium]
MSDDTTNLADSGCVSRRNFLFGSSAVVASSILLPALPGTGGKALAAEMARYPRKLVGKLSSLKTNEVQHFNYPDDGSTAKSVIVKLGTPAGGGIGKGRDVVAFNALCTHMGGDMRKTYKSEHQVLGPCPFHQSTFDLQRHGMIVSGHATESLPQVLLELEGDDIYAVGLIGLIYGRYDNLKG